MTSEEELKIEQGYARLQLWMKKHPRKSYFAAEIVMYFTRNPLPLFLLCID